MRESFAPLFTIDYWMQNPGMPFTVWIGRGLFFVFALCLVSIFFFSVLKRAASVQKERKRLLTRAQYFGAAAGITGLLFFFCTWQGIPILSMRIWMLVWLVCFGIWKARLLWVWMKELPALELARVERERYERWLPKSKH